MNYVLGTERLILRPLTLKDAADVFEWVSDPVVNLYMPYTIYHEISEVENWIRSIEKKDNLFGYELKESKKVIGSGNISFVSEKQSFELGYNLHQKFWRKGYATEAAKAMIQWAKEEAGAKKICANHAVDNMASKRVLEKCGLRFTHNGEYSKFDGSETFQAKFYEMEIV